MTATLSSLLLSCSLGGQGLEADAKAKACEPMILLLTDAMTGE